MCEKKTLTVGKYIQSVKFTGAAILSICSIETKLGEQAIGLHEM